MSYLENIQSIRVSAGRGCSAFGKAGRSLGCRRAAGRMLQPVVPKGSPRFDVKKTPVLEVQGYNRTEHPEVCNPAEEVIGGIPAVVGGTPVVAAGTLVAVVGTLVAVVGTPAADAGNPVAACCSPAVAAFDPVVDVVGSMVVTVEAVIVAELLE